MKTFLLVWALSKGADVGTTAAVLQQGGRESNPMLSSRVSVMLTQQALWSAGELVVIKGLSRNHPKWAKGLAMVSIGGSLYGAVHNGHELTRPRAVAAGQWCDGVYISC